MTTHYRLSGIALVLRVVAACGVIAACSAVAACSSNGHGNPNIGGGQSSGVDNTDFAIVYVKRTMPTDATALVALRNKDDVSLRREYWTKADLFLRDQASPGGTEHNITARITGNAFWDVKDVDVSADAGKVIFAMRGPIAAKQKARDPPSWHIWEYAVASDTLRQLTGGSGDLDPAANDVSPHYLADGRIVFSSTRQVESKSVLQDEAIAASTGPFEAQTESRNESAFVLHVMDANGDGSTIQQISFNQSHDIDATVLASGRLMWSRWDNAPGRAGGSGLHLYTANPDGTDVELLYGAQSHTTAGTNPSGSAACPSGLDCSVQFVHTREMQNGRILALVRPFTGGDFGGNLLSIDVAGHVENNQLYPDNGATAAANALQQPAAEQPATQNDVRTQSVNNLPVPSPGGRFSSAFPLWDGSNRILVSWTDCRLQNATGTILPCTDTNLAAANSATPTLSLAPPLYSAWLLNTGDSTLKPVMVPTEGIMVTEVVSLQARTVPAFIRDLSAPSGFSSYGILDIRSIYDRDGIPAGLGANPTLGAVATASAANRPARFLRVEKAVSIGDPQLKDGFPNFDRALSLDGSVGFMRQILGYVPIEPDGSVRVRIPANVAFQISVLDANARALGNFPRHNSWLTLRPGEVLRCNGCHQPQAAANGVSGVSHGRAGLFTALNRGWGTTFTVTPNGQAAPGAATCVGDTMAEELAATSCDTNPYGATTPALARDVVFTDYWFGGLAAGGNGPISYKYGGPTGLTTPIPTGLVCQTGWSYFCRSIIEYPTHIHPLWTVIRGDITMDPRGSETCTTCHTRARTQQVQQVVNGVTTTVTVPMPPDGNLELDADPAQSTATQLRAYQQLVGAHAALTLNANNQLVASGTTVSGSISPGTALGSRFFVNSNNVQRFGPGGSHYDPVRGVGWLTPAELRLLSEWVDIGAQYYNNPFDAPLAN